ncbi:MAG: tetratricopeptide repeat protein [Candidatus Brocadiaceae bacterium]|nr:tetratricopeptide repeat protein [Candidatus Brocadiaceae bacterium]
MQTDKSQSSIIVIFTLVALSVITYINCLPNQFVYDDTSTIVGNRFIEQWGNLKLFFTQDYFKYSGELTFRPLVTLSYFVDYSLWGKNPMGYHLVNVLLHTMNVVLLYFLIRVCLCHCSNSFLMKTTFSPVNGPSYSGIAFVVCIFFAVHPVVTEVVNLVSYREDLIATAFLIASLLCFFCYRERGIANSLSVSIQRGSVWCSVIALVAYFLALFSKESSIVLPALIVVFDLLFYTDTRNENATSLQKNDRRWKRFLRIVCSPFFLGYLGISAFYLILRFIVFHSPDEKFVYPEGSIFVTMLTTTKVLGRYILHMFLPFNINADYHVLFLKSPFMLSFIIPFFLLVAILVIALRLIKGIDCPSDGLGREKAALPKKNRIVFFGIAWFFISVLPVLNIVPLANIMADRYLYFPIIGFVLVIAVILAHLRITIKLPLIISLVIFYCVITVAKNNLWRDEFSLWTHSSRSTFCSFTTYNNLGTQYKKKGYPDAALRCYDKALEKADEVGFTKYAAVYYNRGNVYEQKGLLEQTVAAYNKAIRLKPNYKEAHNNLGKVYFTRGQYDNALKEYQAAITIDPDFAYAYNNLGVLYNRIGKQDKAKAVYEKALIIDPHYADAFYNLGNIYETNGQYDLALKEYRFALKADPSRAHVHNNMGAIYDRKGLLDEAVVEYQQAIQIDPSYAYSYNNLGASLSRKGDLDGALAVFQKAVDLHPDQPDFRFNLGYALLKKGDLDKALRELETVLKISPSHVEGLSHAGLVYYELGQKERATALWQKALEVNPNHGRTMKFLETLSGE